MVKHNNVIQNLHFRKKYCASSRGPLKVKLALNQAGKKKSRRITRAKKAAAIAPAPLQKLRPVVHCPTQRYNAKTRLGRGFTLDELKGAGVESAAYARSVGIAVELGCSCALPNAVAVGIMPLGREVSVIRSYIREAFGRDLQKAL